MGRTARGSGRIHTRIVVVTAALLASGCSVLFGLDDHSPSVDPGNEGGTPDGNVVSDSGNPINDSGGGGHDATLDAPPSQCEGRFRVTGSRRIDPAGGTSSQFSARGKQGSLTAAYISSDHDPEGSRVLDGTRSSDSLEFGLDARTPGNFNSKMTRHGIATSDDLRMLYIQWTDDAHQDIWLAKKGDSGFTANGAVGINAPTGANEVDTEVYLVNNGDVLYFASNRTNGLFRIYQSVESGSATGNYATPTLLPGLDKATADQRAPVVTNDKKTILFARNGGQGLRIYAAQRATADGDFSEASLVCDVNASGEGQYPTWISPANNALYFVNVRSGKYELWQASIAIPSP